MLKSCTPTTPPLSMGYILGSQSSGMKRNDKYVEMTNIGNGFASTLAIHTINNIGGISINKLVTVGATEKIKFCINDNDIKNGNSIHFGISFVDSKTNEYMQEYDLYHKDGALQIDCGYPHLIEN